MILKGCLSLDIGKKNIKLVYGKLNGQKVDIVSYDVIKTPIGSIQDGKIIEIEPILEAVNKSIKKHGIKSKKLKLNVSGTGVITREIKIPKVSEKEIDSILEFEAPQYFPVSLEDYVMDYKILEEVEEDDGVFFRLLLAAVPNIQIEGYMEIPKLLKMEIELIDIPSNSLYKYMIQGRKLTEDDDEKKEFAVIDFGAETTTVCIFSNETLMFNRVLLKGSKEIDEKISISMNVDYESGEQLKKEKLFLLFDEKKEEIEEDSIRLSEAVKEVINGQIDDINKFLNFYNSRTYGNKVNKIFICGGGSKIQGFDKYMSIFMGLPVERLNYENRVTYRNKKDKENFADKFPFLLNAIGLVI